MAAFQASESLLKDKGESPDVVILDHFLSNELGLVVLKEVRQIWPNTRVIYLSGQTKVNVAIESIKTGAYAYAEKNTKAYSKINDLIGSEIIDGSYLL